MNKLEKKSFYSFLALYSISSFLFIVLSGYWYYNGQESMLKSNHQYKLQHISDSVSQKIIYSHMQGKELTLPVLEEGVSIALVDVNDKLIYGNIIGDITLSHKEYFEEDPYANFVSDAPQQHLGIRYVIVQSMSLHKEIKELKQQVFSVVLLVVLIVIGLAWVLSRLFMRPLHQKIEQIEGFVHDTAHELNTPITALSMSVSRALKSKSYDEKILKNISISTKQLFDIYSALSYLSFEVQEKNTEYIDIHSVLLKSVTYYKELSDTKKIVLNVEAESFIFKIDEPKLSMLFGNLISNAIKYSLPESSIELSLKEGFFSIEDHGIGIDKNKLSQVFEPYNRQTKYAGGFGVGLSIVKKIADEYGIEVRVSSVKSQGTKVYLDFTTKA